MKKIVAFIFTVLGIDGTLQLGSSFLVCDRIDEVINDASARGGYMLNDDGQQRHSHKPQRNDFSHGVSFKKLSHELDFA